VRRLAIALLLAGCGGAHQPPRPEDVIRAWSDAMRRSDIAAADARFGVPVVVANGTAPIQLTTREQVHAFNSSLPCGSRLVSTRARDALVIATFVLTERPGETCDGTGHTAYAAFEVRDGLIRRWLRIVQGAGTPA
jgi:limonene-1,2-epoxide hydrolase